jgi:hypothetical protein
MFFVVGVFFMGIMDGMEKWGPRKDTFSQVEKVLEKHPRNQPLYT